MSIGNKWQYARYINVVSLGTLQGYSTLSVIGDSIMPNGKKYKVILKVPSNAGGFSFTLSNPAYLRIDSTGANIYEANFSVGGGEQLWDSLLARPHEGSRWGEALGIRRDTILGVPTVTRSLGFYIDRPSRTLAYNLGPVGFGFIDEGDEFAHIDRLVYARLDGHEYGTLVSVNSPTQTVPKEFELLHNYPNPFNPSTTIRYSLPTRVHVTLSVFNTLGQLVSVLVNETQDTSYHDVRFDGSGLASGVYFYQLRVGTYVETKKLLILR